MLERANTNRLLPKRGLCIGSGQRMRVKIVRKFANVLNGIDLTKVSVGDVVNLMPDQAALLIAEGWAVEAPDTPGTLVNLRSSRKRNARRGTNSSHV
jgi:hypothetical protein